MHKAGAGLRIGTRGSPLALAQAELVVAALEAAGLCARGACEVVVIRTTGDRVQDRPLADIGGKALWTRELDAALAERRIDLAVHSMKDVETQRPDWLTIAAMLPRADVRDRLIGAESLAALPQGARVGTSSPRRAAQLLALRGDLAIVPLRGNVDTRLAKLQGGDMDATLLAAAGLDRLGRDAGTPIGVDLLLPAPAQGAIGIECRSDDHDLVRHLDVMAHHPTLLAVRCERALLAALGGSCHTPVAALARIEGEALRLDAEILLPDGSERVRTSVRGRLDQGRDLAAKAAADLLERASPALAAQFSPPR